LEAGFKTATTAADPSKMKHSIRSLLYAVIAFALFAVDDAFTPPVVNEARSQPNSCLPLAIISPTYLAPRESKSRVLHSRKKNGVLPQSKTRKLIFVLQSFLGLLKERLSCAGSFDKARKAARWLKDYTATPNLRASKHEAHIHELLIEAPPFPFTNLIAHEWTVEDGHGPLAVGVGDLLFKKPRSNEYLVVEAKFLKKTTCRQTNKRKRCHVKKQAKFYAHKASKILSPFAYVHFAYSTNEDGIKYLGNYWLGKEMRLHDM